MRMTRMRLIPSVIWLVFSWMAITPGAFAEDTESSVKYSQQELEQVVALVALYPDDLLSQIFMASTYPLEVVQAERWARQNKGLKGDDLTRELEKQDWEPSVKSLVNFPEVLTMMTEKLDWTEKLGNAFLDQQKDVMNAVQTLRKKAQAKGNLKSSKEQTVVVEQEAIMIQPASPEVIYVPAYDPEVVYGTWPYPAYLPYDYYPSGYVASPGLYFAAGVAVGSPWGYSWGRFDWRGGDLGVDIDRNTHVNNSIDRGKYRDKVSAAGAGKGSWQHNPEHRKGVSYRDQATASRFNRGGSEDAARSREAFRGRSEQGGQDLARTGGERAGQLDRSPSVGVSEARTRAVVARQGVGAGNVRIQNRDDAFQGMGGSGREARNFSSRGSESRNSSLGRGDGINRGGGGGGVIRGGGGGGRRR